MHVRRQKRIRAEMIKRGYIETYLPYIGEALRDILNLKENQVHAVEDKLKVILEKTRTV
jgi:DNA topoisomerase VI subunit B